MSESDKRILAIFALLALVIGIGAMTESDEPLPWDDKEESVRCR